MTRPFDKALAACLFAGGILGIMLTTVADIQSSTPGPLPPPGDIVTPVTTSYSVFGVTVRESTGPSGSDQSRRFGQFYSMVGLAFVIAGMVVGLVVYLIAFRQRGPADAGPSTATVGGV